MKTKNKRNKINKTRKGGHKVDYNYQGNIDAGTNRPLTGRHVNNNNCLACAMHSLGYMTERTARYLQRMMPHGVVKQMVLDMVNNTYGPGHVFKISDTTESVNAYLKPGEATLGYYGSYSANQFDELGHYFVVFRSEKNGNLYIIDSQQHLVMPIFEYLHKHASSNLELLTEPDVKVRPKYKFIIPEVIRDAIEKHRVRFRQQLLANQPPMPFAIAAEEMQADPDRKFVIPSGVRNQYTGNELD
jgi:hypothetical protein